MNVLSLEELKDRGAIYIKDILFGFDNYKSEILTLSEQEAEEFFKEMWIDSGKKNCYVDFYYFTLNDEARKIVEKELTKEEIVFLQGIKPEETDKIYFEFDQALLKIVVKLNAREILFSTFYFINNKSTWWGNYNKEYVKFSQNEFKEK